MKSVVGLNRVILTTLTKLLTDQSNLVSVGLRKPGVLNIGPFKNQSDQRSRSLRNKINFKADAESYQLGLRDLELLIGFCQNGFDSQVVAEKQTSTVDSGGRFDFVGDNTKGLEFEHKMSGDDRLTKITIEGAEEYENALTLIDASDGFGALAPDISSFAQVGSNQKGNAKAFYKHPWYFAIESPDSTELFDKKELITRMFSLKTVGSRNEYNELQVDYIKLMLEVQGFNATIANLVTILSKAQFPSLTVKEYNTATLYDKYVIPAEVVNFEPEFEIGDEKRNAKLKFEADIPLNDFSFAYGTPNGGSATDAAAEQVGAGTPAMTEAEARTGGTCTIAA